MKQISISEIWGGGLKALAVGILFFLLLFLIMGVIISYTPMQEKWMKLSVIAALSVGCFFSGMLAGKRIGKKGLVFGMLFSVFLILSVTGGTMIFGLLGKQGMAFDGFFRIAYIPCILCGAAGGMAGVNMHAG